MPSPGRPRRAHHAARRRPRGCRGGRRGRARHGADARLLHDLVAPRRPRRRTATSTGACSRTSSTRPPPRSPSATSRSSPGSSTTSGRSRRTRRCSRTRRSPRIRPRLPYENFYYVQEDILFAAAERDGFTWSVHRPHTLIGWALGNAMNMGVTLAVYAAICRETGRGFHFPGSREQWEAVTDVTDAGLLADHLVWAATTPAAANQALNIVNGDVFRWRRLWPRLAAALGVEPVPFDGEPAPLEQQMADAAEVWPEIVRRHGLRDLDVDTPRLVVAHGRRPRPHGRDVHRHGAQPAARLPRRPRHASPRSPISSRACGPSGSCRDGWTRRRRCGRFASTPRTTSGSRTSPSRPRRAPGEVVVRVVDLRHLRHRPARVRRRPDRHARRAASADRSAEPADPRARVRRRRRRDRRRA